MIMTKFTKNTLTAAVLVFSAINVYAGEVCKVSMMGRICYEEGSPEAKAAHMKEDAVAETSAKKKTEAGEVDAKGKKVAEKYCMSLR